MNYAGITKAALRGFLGFLGLTALIAIISVVGGEFGEREAKIILSTLTISLASVCAMSCAAFIARRKQPLIGLAGMASAVVAAVLVIIGIWPEIESDVYWKVTGTFGLAAFALAHGFLLILPDLRSGKSWFQTASFVSIMVLALQLIVAMWGDIGSETYYRMVAVVGILVGLETVSLPILIKLGKGQKKAVLVLEKVEGEIFVDSSGARYRVIPE